MITGINHITLSVADLNRAFHFYTHVLLLKPIAKWKKGAYLLAGNDWICLSLDRHTRDLPVSEYTHFAFSVDENKFDKMAKLLADEGCKEWNTNKSEGRSLYILDPDGHKLELHVGNLKTRIDALQKEPYDDLVIYNQS
ncbi:MAG: VOC family protein [Balneolaceae bacterium]|jgi:catechol 2,3-dioxygenase-like lactoylglutathione lyase family enzyme